MPSVDPSWQAQLSDQFEQPYWCTLGSFLAKEREAYAVYPPEAEVFRAFELTPFPAVKVLLLGQDPYHGEGQAHGLSFSVPPGVKPPPSLANLYKELQEDLGLQPPAHGCLDAWARRGVLLLNTVLTVRADEANSHRGKGWEQLTDCVIERVNAKPEKVVFLLLGASAHKKAKLVDRTRHAVVACAHPSPLSVQKFRGSRPFSAVNRELEAAGQEPIDWRLPGDP